MIKGKALKRALKTNDAHRILENLPGIVDTTELITPAIAEKLLMKNENNRPVNWNKVEVYKKLMELGEWKFHAQGIILDGKGNIITGQKRLWAIVLCGISQYMRVSRGSLPETAPFIDRGTAQSSRDLATRQTKRKHSPTEASIMRAYLALQGNVKPSADEIADAIVEHEPALNNIMETTAGTRKNKAMLMILGATCALDGVDRELWLGNLDLLAGKLETEVCAAKCWNRGAAFSLAMKKAVQVCKNNI